MHNLSIYLSFFMIAILLLLAGLCFFTETLSMYAAGNKKYLLGSIFFLYAVVRTTRIRKQMIQNKREKLHE